MKSPLPVFSIYGERVRDQTQAQVLDWLHCESIAERAHLHDWEISPHQHDLLLQIFWIARGRCTVSLDMAVHTVQGPCLLLIPPRCMHGFHFHPHISGTVITVLAQHARQLLATQPALNARLAQAAALPVDRPTARIIAAAMAVLQQEFANVQAWRAIALDSALTQLLVKLGRSLPSDPQEAPRRGDSAHRHLQRYIALIEDAYRQQPSLAELARQLGVTGTQLNRICQAALQCTALDVMHARTLLEAQRELTYTSMSIKQIALGLGFSDSAYFTRFFQRKAGATPSAWRSEKAAQR
ncbi:helix-turn-helix domain-containing protein [Roseateles koreensis]|uniref:Helix-turn-helix domain-containing protein n=1 Tax=Roseateles koreensis TaxID=2987526 RepID=A0ABT5KWS0_9BURK|nr:helix-turn-helix domain-containing protein [Roseateles koreensis]MDC8787246.1 helix-turn-helix domain-containing protein [Roseateles koreensis]